MGVRMLVVAGSVVAGLGLVMVASASPAGAAPVGGWAISSLDPMSVPVAGEEVEVGFTIRQHGATPVNPDDGGGEAVAVAIWSASGDRALFPARQEGPTGHYVADVTFPDVGRARWEIHQGWFGAQDLGAIDVAAPGTGGTAQGSAAAGGHHRWPLAARAAAVALAGAAAGVAVADVWHARRRRRRLADAVPL
jgi:hypothetical protein